MAKFIIIFFVGPNLTGRNARKFRVAGLEACTSGSFPSIAHGKAERVNKPPHAESQMEQADKRPPFCQLLWILEKPHLPAKSGKCRKVCTVSRQVEAGTQVLLHSLPPAIRQSLGCPSSGDRL